jgi:hypothetical protein
VSAYITTTIHSLNDAIQVLQDILSGGLRLWDDFITLVKRVGTTRLISWGVNDSTFLVGHILRLLGTSVTLSDEALTALKSVSDDLVAIGVDLSDDAAQGLGLAAKGLGSNELRAFANTLKANGPEHLETILKAYKNFDTVTREGAEKLAQKLGGEKFAQLMSKFATNSFDSDQVFRILGNTNVSKEALTIAIKQSPDSVKALSYWDTPLLENSTIAKELAERAGKDVLALEAVNELLAQGGNNPTLINHISDLSLQNNGNFTMLGIWDGLENGYAKAARDLTAIYWYPHPDIYNRLGLLGDAQREATWWALDSAAIRGGAGNAMAFKYTLLDGIPQDTEALDLLYELVPSRRLSQTERESLISFIDAELANIYASSANGVVPDRMKELRILILEFDYKINIDSSNMYKFSPK